MKSRKICSFFVLVAVMLTSLSMSAYATSLDTESQYAKNAGSFAALDCTEEVQSSVTGSIPKYVGYAYSIGGEFHDGEDVKTMADYWAVSGYHSYYNDDPTYDYVSNANRLNSDILYFSSHGSQYRLSLLNGIKLTSGYSNSAQNQVGILDYSLTNNRVVIYDACETAKGSSNLCTATYGQGAAAVLGWPESVYASDSYNWMKRFADYASRGYSLNKSIQHADSYSDYLDNAIIKSHILYGDGEQDIQLNWRQAGPALEQDEIKREVTPHDNISSTQIVQAIKEMNPDFDESNYKVSVSENESLSTITVDYVEIVNGFITSSGYTVRIKDGIVDKIFDNTLTLSETTRSMPIAVSDLDYGDAETIARAEIEDRGDTIKSIVSEPFLDLLTGQAFIRTKVIYYYQGGIDLGGTVFYYDLTA